MKTSEMDLAAYLSSKGIQTHRAAGAEITAQCFAGCNPGHGGAKGKGKWYGNTDSWLWSCRVCLASGNRKTLLELFGDEDAITYSPSADPSLRRRILDETASLAHEMLLNNDEMLGYLLGRGLSPELIVSHRLGYVPKNVGISEMIPMRESGELKGYEALIAAGVVTPGGHEFFNNCLTIPYFAHGQVVQIRARKMAEGGARYLTSGGDNVRLYNADSLHGASRVLVVEGEIDCLSVLTAIEQSNDRWFEDLAVVGLAGAGSWPDGFVESLSRCDRIFAGFDPDETGEKAARKLKEEVGTKGRIVQLPKALPKADWNAWLGPLTEKNPHGGHGSQDVKELLVEADLAGKTLFSIEDLSAKWSRRESDAPGLKLGFPQIDAVIRPGVKPGQLFIPLAGTGVGKSLFLSNVAHSVSTRHRGVLYVSMEMTGAEIFEHLRRIHRFWNQKAGRDELVLDYSKLQVVERNRIKQGDMGTLIQEYRDLYESQGPDLVIVDYLQYFARGFRGQPYERVTDAVMELKAIAKEENVAIIAPSQVNRGAERGKPLSLDAARDGGTIEETADFVMSMFRPDQALATDGEQIQTGSFTTQFLKSRHGGVGRTCSLKLSNMSLALVDTVFDKPAVARVDTENRLVREGMHYTEYREQLDNAIAQGRLM